MKAELSEALQSAGAAYEVKSEQGPPQLEMERATTLASRTAAVRQLILSIDRDTYNSDPEFKALVDAAAQFHEVAAAEAYTEEGAADRFVAAVFNHHQELQIPPNVMQKPVATIASSHLSNALQHKLEATQIDLPFNENSSRENP